MQGRNLIIIGVALLLGLAAVFIANAYFSGVEQKQAQVAKSQELTNVVVAATDLSFGTVLSAQNLRIVTWPAASVPPGAFRSIEDATRGGQATLRPIAPGEPVLASKLSTRPTLSANLPKGQYAVAIPISATAAAGGFVRPGDRVDVLLTRKIPGDGAGDQDKMTDVVLSGVPVLAIDVDASDSSTEPKVGKTATLQVDTLGAQKLALSSQLGVLSLALRNGADPDLAAATTVIPPQLSARRYYISKRDTGAAGAPALPLPPLALNASKGEAPVRPSGPSMVIFRGNESTAYEVQRGY